MTAHLVSAEQAAQWLRSRVTGSLTTDSRQVREGDGFIAWPGAAHDGRHFIGSATAAGARACVVERSGAEAFQLDEVIVRDYADLKADAGWIAAHFFDRPSEKLDVVAVTGTNGKTSTAWWLAQALSRANRRCGLIGTLGMGEPGRLVMSGLTTPDPVLLQRQLNDFVHEGYAACVMEASSIGIAEHRLNGVAIHTAIFTNLTQDHLDYHPSMAEYWAAKKALFDRPELKSVVVNLDDHKGKELHDSLSGRALDMWTFSCAVPARLQARNIQHLPSGIVFDAVEGGDSRVVTTCMVGAYNVSNLLGVMAALRSLGMPLATAVDACTNLLPVPGRMETLISERLPLVVVDYAHTPDALEKVLSALQPVAAGRGGRLWCVFGCGGDRDSSKRPLMAIAAEKHAGAIVLTSDNPRSEPPDSILAQVLKGFAVPDAVHVEPDRAAAIAWALTNADAQDVVVLAGKGHETYQDINGFRHVFSDRDHAQAALALRAAQEAHS